MTKQANDRRKPFGDETDSVKQEFTVKKERNLHIDLIRCLSCFAVVGLHTIGRNYSNINLFLYYSCGFAVPAFFMAMGFIQLNTTSKSYKYYFKRCVCILVIVFFWNTIEYILETINALRSGKTLVFDVFEPLRMAMLSLLQRGSLDKFWFFGSTIIVYLLIPLLNGLDSRKKRKIWFLCLAGSFLVYILSLVIHQPLQVHVIQTFRVWTWTQYLLLGWMLFYYKEEVTKHIHINTGLFILLSLLVVTVHILLGKYHFTRTEAEWFYDDPLQIIWLVYIFEFIGRIQFNSVAHKAIKWISPLTMGVFIIHSILIRIMWVFIPVDNANIAILSWPAVFMASVTCSWILRKIPFVNRMISI